MVFQAGQDGERPGSAAQNNDAFLFHRNKSVANILDAGEREVRPNDERATQRVAPTMRYTAGRIFMARKSAHTKLGEFAATSIAGNDILSSALYVSGIAALFAGIYAPLVLLAVACVLFFYRSVYREVVGALPVNGGAYNALLNGTSKPFAAIAGVMTILSYVATAVISGKTALQYLFVLLKRIQPMFAWASGVDLNSFILPGVIAILLFFAVLVVLGIRDSAKLASGIFILHILTLTSFIFFGLFVLLTHYTGIWQLNLEATRTLVAGQGGLLKTLFLAFSVSLLGVSGFESSANFVEEQAPSVFPKTLRNMAVGILVFNPLLALITLNILPLDQIIANKDFVLASSAVAMGGLAFLALVAVDAFLVLSGAVLTSFVGVTGLVHRMALDGCLPTSLVKENKRGAHPRIILAFFLLCVSILFVTRGDLLSLAGVYTISFLSVMTFFAASNLILRVNRPDLKRPYKAPFIFVVVALLSTFIGVMGNISIDPKNTGYFLTYFIPAVAFTFAVIERRRLYKALARITSWFRPLSRFFRRKEREATRDRVYVFVHHIDRLYRILEYIYKNEPSEQVTLIHCSHGHPGRAKELEHVIETIKTAGFFRGFTIHVHYIKQAFSPQTVLNYATRHHINPNKIFIGSIHEYHAFNYEDLGGARVIL